MREDITTGQIYIFYAPLTGKEAEVFSGLAAFNAPDFMPYEKDFPLDRYAFDEFLPRRVVWEITLKPEADAWSDLFTKQSTLTASALSADGGMIAMTSIPEEHTNDLWLYLDAQNQMISLNIFAPEGFTNRVEIYSCTGLVSGVWDVAQQNLYPGTNPAVWDVTSNISNRFFRAGNMDIDSDGDGLPDAREQIVYKTNPESADSDGDTFSDYQELYADFTDPNNQDVLPPVVWISGIHKKKAIMP